MDKIQIIKRKHGQVDVRFSENQFKVYQKFVARQETMIEQSQQKGALKNVIPVMLNKFNRWLNGLEVLVYPDVPKIVQKIKKIRDGRQHMSIKDLISLCKNKAIREYWISFLEDGHAKESIEKMKKNTNKSLYKSQIGSLLRETLNPKVREMPFKNFISNSNLSVYENFDEEPAISDFYEEEEQVICKSISSTWDLDS